MKRVVIAISAALLLNFAGSVAADPMPGVGVVKHNAKGAKAPELKASGFELWTERAGNVSASTLVKDLRPIVNAASAVYGSGTFDKAERTNWQDYADDIGLTNKVVDDIESIGFNAAVHEVGGKYVLAFRGSDLPWTLGGDWIPGNLRNALYGAGETGQYIFALVLAEAVAKKYGSDNVILTGHSLGGGLAAYAGATLELPTVTFNAAAGVFGPRTVYSDEGEAAVLNFVVEGDVVPKVGSLVGKSITLDDALFNNWVTRTVQIGKTLGPVPGAAAAVFREIHLHDMKRFASALKAAENGDLAFQKISASRAVIGRR